MASKKIGINNLDDELLKKIQEIILSGSIELTDLSAELQTLIRKAGAITPSGNYDDSYLSKEVADLKTNKLDVAAAADFISASKEEITAGMLSQQLRSALGLTANGATVTTRTWATVEELVNNYRKKIDAIQKSDLSIDVQNELNSMSSNIDSILEALKSQTLDLTTISNMQLAIGQNKSDIATTNLAYVAADDQIKIDMQKKIDAQNLVISDLSKSVVNVSYDGTGNKILESYLEDSVVAKIDAVPGMQTNISTLQSSMADATADIIDLKNEQLIYPMFFSYSSTDTNALMAAMKSPILDLENNNIIEIDSATGQYKTTVINFVANKKFDSKFFHDVNTGKVLVLKMNTADPSLTKLAVMKYAVKKFDITVAAGSVYSYTVGDIYEMKPTVMVQNKYTVNGVDTKIHASMELTDFIDTNELYVSIGYKTNAIVIMNNTDYSLNFRIVHNA